MIYIAYLDEFGHVGPYVSRTHARHNDSPVFGFAGYLLPAEEVRSFGTWFFQRKCELLGSQIQQSGKHPAVWEKKGSKLYTARSVRRYPEVRAFTHRLLRRIASAGGAVVYVGVRKTATPEEHRSLGLYERMLREVIRRIDEYCRVDCPPSSRFLLALDEHPRRAELLTSVSQDMYGGEEPRRQLIEPPFHLESHRYQTVQAADWIAGLVGRIGAFWVEEAAWPENEVFHRYFESRLWAVRVRSGIRD